MADKVANVKYQISAPGAEQTLGLFGKLSQAVKEQGKAMEASGTTKLLETLRGGGIAMGITALSRGLTAGLTETRATIQEVLAGQLSMVQASSDFREQLAGSLPIMGDVWRMGRQIRDTFEDWQALLARSGDESSESTLSGKIAKFLGMKPGQASGETLQRIANAQTALQDQAHAAMKNMNMAADLAETTGFDQMFVKLKQDDDARRALIRDTQSIGTNMQASDPSMAKDFFNTAKVMTEAADKIKAGGVKLLQNQITEIVAGARTVFSTAMSAGAVAVFEADRKPFEAMAEQLKQAAKNQIESIEAEARRLTLAVPSEAAQIKKNTLIQEEVTMHTLLLNIDKARNVEAERLFNVSQARFGIDQAIAAEATNQLRQKFGLQPGGPTPAQTEQLRQLDLKSDFANRRNALLNQAMSPDATNGQIVNALKATYALNALQAQASKPLPTVFQAQLATSAIASPFLTGLKQATQEKTWVDPLVDKQEKTNTLLTDIQKGIDAMVEALEPLGKAVPAVIGLFGN